MSDSAPGHGNGHGQPHKQYTVLVNNKPVKLDDDRVTGAQIETAAGLPTSFKLYDPSGAEIADDQTVVIKSGEHFTAISGQDVS